MVCWGNEPDEECEAFKRNMGSMWPCGRSRLFRVYGGVQALRMIGGLRKGMLVGAGRVVVDGEMLEVGVISAAGKNCGGRFERRGRSTMSVFHMTARIASSAMGAPGV